MAESSAAGWDGFESFFLDGFGEGFRRRIDNAGL